MNKLFQRAIKGKSVEYLLGLHSEILLRLRELGVIRTTNNPAGDYAEYIACKLFKLKIAPNSTKSYDAIDKLGKKYQVKARRITAHNNSRLLGVIRDLDNADFHFLIAVIFNEDYSLNAVYKIPKSIIPKYARLSVHQNGHILNMKGLILKDPKVLVKTTTLKKKLA